MSKFLTGENLDNAICDIIWKAERTLLIVSPFIKLDDYFKKLFNNHENNPKLHIIIVFGKNEKAVRRSLSRDDFDFFKKFLNVSIIYVPNLHAKYYGNEKQGVITSINLYDYSFKNNIEFGVFSEQSLMDKFKQSPDNDAWNECMEIAHENEVVFIKRPVFENKKVIINLGKNYVKSDVLFDSTKKFYGVFKSKGKEAQKLSDFPQELLLGTTPVDRPKREVEEKKKEKARFSKSGYCIRTGVEIPYNPNQPMTYESWKVWNQFGDPDYPESFCHQTGRKSHGKTSMRRPIMY
ncbi:phospholipase D family protein [Mangrovimonas aestuarii]|uniref:phospholipase D family protein n=1 Tax=Mangrovimonas aestuarii TaxID=3018443 RepID=UPI00237953B9|nr:phospholipase D family protein [Mangrovimonas aestuarii]